MPRLLAVINCQEFRKSVIIFHIHLQNDLPSSFIDIFLNHKEKSRQQEFITCLVTKNHSKLPTQISFCTMTNYGMVLFQCRFCISRTSFLRIGIGVKCAMVVLKVADGQSRYFFAKLMIFNPIFTKKTQLHFEITYHLIQILTLTWQKL